NLRTDVYADNSQQLASSLERQFDETAAVHDRGWPSPGACCERQLKGEAVSAGHAAQQGRQRKRLRRVKTWGGSMRVDLAPAPPVVSRVAPPRWWRRRSSSSTSSPRRRAWPQRHRPPSRRSAPAG